MVRDQERDKTLKHIWQQHQESEEGWEVLKVFDSEAAAQVSGVAETVDYFE